jgi:hypothetical protein
VAIIVTLPLALDTQRERPDGSNAFTYVHDLSWQQRCQSRTDQQLPEIAALTSESSLTEPGLKGSVAGVQKICSYKSFPKLFAAALPG